MDDDDEDDSDVDDDEREKESVLPLSSPSVSLAVIYSSIFFFFLFFSSHISALALTHRVFLSAAGVRVFFPHFQAHKFGHTFKCYQSNIKQSLGNNFPKNKWIYIWIRAGGRQNQNPNENTKLNFVKQLSFSLGFRSEFARYKFMIMFSLPLLLLLLYLTIYGLLFVPFWPTKGDFLIHTQRHAQNHFEMDNKVFALVLLFSCAVCVEEITK